MDGDPVTVVVVVACEVVWRLSKNVVVVVSAVSVKVDVMVVVLAGVWVSVEMLVTPHTSRA